MKIQTKFNLDQKVYPISQISKIEFIPCLTCGGDGFIIVKATEVKRVCPECFGRKGADVWKNLEWQVRYDTLSYIGKIEVERYADEYKGDHESKNMYMLDATGVGSGSVWDEENLFATEEEALTECRKRNEIKEP